MPINPTKIGIITQERTSQNSTHYRPFTIKAVWLTTAYNLDWPRHSAANPFEAEEQKIELCHILDQIKKDGYNTVFFQVRTSLGVAYPSSLEPMAITLVREGSIPYYDPTAFALKECHKRGLKFHAWFVTFPLGGAKAYRLRRKYSILQNHPEWTILFRKAWYLDPGNPYARQYLTNVIKEAVTKYNFDGVHLDYIRYPDGASHFPDSKSYKKWGLGKNIADWRRNNISETIRLIKETIEKIRPRILLSAAPLGKRIHIPEEKIGVKYGWTAYESVYQDPLQWARNHWVDFIVPMMYYRNKLFSPFLSDWINTVGKYCPVVPGLAAYRVYQDSNPLWSISDIHNQIEESRSKGAGGIAIFRYQFVSERYPVLKNTIKKDLNEPDIIPTKTPIIPTYTRVR